MLGCDYAVRSPLEICSTFLFTLYSLWPDRPSAQGGQAAMNLGAVD